MTQIIPGARQPVIIQGASGRENSFTRPWLLFFQAVNDFLKSTGVVPGAAVVGPSPFTQAVEVDGVFFIVGGTVTLIEYVRGATFTNTGAIAGSFFVFAGDALRITYAVAPTVSFVHR